MKKKFDDLSKDEKQKFIAMYSLKQLFRNELLSGIYLSFFTFLIGCVVFVGGVSLNGVIATLYLKTNNDSYLELASVVTDIALYGFLFMFIIGIIIFFVSYYMWEQDKKRIYAIFESDGMIEDVLGLDNSDLKKIKLRHKKVE